MIIGIDPSLTATGLCSEAGGTFGYGSTDIVKSSPVDAVNDPVSATITRCHGIMDDIDTFLLRVGNGPYNFFMEGPAFHDANHLLEMGIWYASFHHRFHGPPHTITLIAPATLKKFIGGKGNLKKNEVPLKVFKKWGIEFEKDPGFDLAHAFALCKLGESILDGTYDIGPQQRRGRGRTAITATRRAHRNPKVQA